MKLREEVKGVLGIGLLYLIAIVGIVLINARLGAMQNKSVDAETPTQYTNVNQKINK